MNGRWKALIAVAVVVCAVIVAALLLNQSPATPSPAPSKDAGLGPAGKLGFPTSRLAVGTGGTKTAADGKTPIGYDGSCDSAALAAANYLPLLNDLNTNTWAKQKKALVEVSLPGPTKKQLLQINDTVVSQASAQKAGFDDGWILKSDVRAGGLYRLVSCEPRKSALVQVFSGTLSAQVSTAPRPDFRTSVVELSWEGKDWKYANAFQPSPEDPTRGGLLKDEGPSLHPEGFLQNLPVLTAGDVESLFKKVVREGWVEYANAIR